MSVQALTWVMEHSQARLGDRLVLMSIANHADREGCQAWPSVPTIAKEAHLSDRQVRRCLLNLVEQGELEIFEGAGPRGTHMYRLPGMRQPALFETEDPPPDNLSGVNLSADKSDTKGVTNPTETPDRMSPKPSFNRPLNKRRDAPRPRDEIFDAVIAACGWDPDELTADARGRVNAAVKQLRALETTADEIHRRARVYRRKFQGVALTPQALTGNWAALAAGAAQQAPPLPAETEQQRAERERRERIGNANSLRQLMGSPKDLERDVAESILEWCDRVERAWDQHTRAPRGAIGSTR